MCRYRHQVYERSTMPRWVAVFGLQWQVIESHRLEPAADLYGALAAAIERQAARVFRRRFFRFFDHSFVLPFDDATNNRRFVHVSLLRRCEAGASASAPISSAINVYGPRRSHMENCMTSSVHRFAPLVSLIFLSGCGTTSVRELSPTTYSVSAQYGSLNGSWDRAQRDAIEKGTQFCTAKNQTFALLNERRSGTFGFSPQQSTITFSCGP